MTAPDPFPLPEAPSEAEKEVLRAAAVGEMAQLRGRSIRAGLIRSLLFGGVAPGRLTPLGLGIRGGRIEGLLDLRGLGSAEAPAPALVLWDMNLKEDTPDLNVDLAGATLAELDLRGTRLAWIEAPDLTLRRQLELSGCRSGPDTVWNFEGARIGGHVVLDGAAVTGEVRFAGAEVGGRFAIGARTTIEGTGDVALRCDGIQVKGDMFLNGAAITGEVRFLDAGVGGAFLAQAGARINREGSFALSCDRIKVRGGVFLEGAAITGGVRFLGAEIDGEFNAGATIVHPGGPGPALDLYTAHVGTSFFLRNAMLDGGIELRGARIGGDVVLGNARVFASADRLIALSGEGLQVGGNVVLGEPDRSRFATVTGRIDLARARISGSLLLTGARLVLAPRATGEGPASEQDLVLSLEQARIEARLEVLHLPDETGGTVDLRGAHVGVLDDAGGAGWGRHCHPHEPPCDANGRRKDGVLLRLDGLTYDRLPDFEGQVATEKTSAGLVRECRHAFLMRVFPGPRPGPHHFAPQPFEQVVKVLRGAGHPQEADWFARGKRVFRTRCRVDSRAARAVDTALNLGFGHFYSPLRALTTLALAVLLGTGLLLEASEADVYVKKQNEVVLDQKQLGVIAPRSGAAAEDPPSRLPRRERCWSIGPNPPSAHSLGNVLEAMLVALDLLLPLVDLKQDQRCEVDTDHAWQRPWTVIFAVYSGLGLILVPLFIATVSGLARRD